MIKRKKFIKPAITLGLLLSQWTWMQQVLAARTAELSISAIVTGQCRIRVVGPAGAYLVDCTGGAPRPQTLLTPAVDATPPATAPGTDKALERQPATRDNATPVREVSVTTLVY